MICFMLSMNVFDVLMLTQLDYIHSLYIYYYCNIRYFSDIICFVLILLIVLGHMPSIFCLDKSLYFSITSNITIAKFLILEVSFEKSLYLVSGTKFWIFESLEMHVEECIIS